MTDEFQNSKNRRRYARANIYAITRYVCPISDDAVEVQTRISDISEGVVFMLTFMEKLPPEALVKMNFVIPGANGGFMAVKGKVKYTKVLEKDSYRSGIEFLELERTGLLAIREYVASHPAK